MLVTGSRLVTGLDDQAQSQSQGPNVAGSALGVFTQLTTQLQAAQRVLADLNAQLNTIVASSTRLVSGQDAAGPASGFDNVLQTLNSVTGQLQALQRVLTDLSSQFNRMVTTGSRLVSGQNAGEATNPAAAIFAGLAQVTNQFASVQTVLTDLSAQLNQLVATSSRLVSGQQADGAPAGPQPPTDQALSALQQVTSQFAAIQRVLTDLSSQLNRMVETGSRLVTSG
ncbi:hypothetical protein HDE_04913 [Halotydeus destructor]|nr:hypothetical protein HDE_04913 [Halotydeus destructor]